MKIEGLPPVAARVFILKKPEPVNLKYRIKRF